MYVISWFWLVAFNDNKNSSYNLESVCCDMISVQATSCFSCETPVHFESTRVVDQRVDIDNTAHRPDLTVLIWEHRAGTAIFLESLKYQQYIRYLRRSKLSIEFNLKYKFNAKNPILKAKNIYIILPHGIFVWPLCLHTYMNTGWTVIEISLPLKSKATICKKKDACKKRAEDL